MADPTVVVPPVPGTPEHDAAMAAKFDAANADPATPATTPADETRPEWLPEKFKTVEEFATSYAELEKKLGKPADAPAADTGDASADAARATVADAGLDFDVLAGEYAESGTLSDDAYAKLEAAGIPKDIVDGFIAGQVAVAENLRATAFAAAGGEDSYTSMIQWASTSMAPAEVAAFNQTVAGNNADQIKFAVAGLKARYQAVNGSDPSLLGGDHNASNGDTYDNWHQVKTAMKDPRYSKDAAYRKSVEEKLGRSTPT